MSIKITEEKIAEYLNLQGSLDEQKKYISTLTRKEQLEEAIENGYHAFDYDRWQHLQNIIFSNEIETLDYETCQSIINLLYKKDIEVMEIWSFKEH